MRNLWLPICLLVLAASMLVSAVIIRNGLLASADRSRPQPTPPVKSEAVVYNCFYPVDYARPHTPSTFASWAPSPTLDGGQLLQSIDMTAFPVVLSSQEFQGSGTMDLLAPPLPAWTTTSPNR